MMGSAMTSSATLSLDMPAVQMGARLSEQLADALAALETAVRNGSDGAAQDVAFHMSIARASGNPFIQATLEYLGQYLRGATQVTRANEARRADYAEQVRREHGAIVEAIAAGE